jgi:manganese/zinc/iron transport system permease protein
MTWVPEIDTWIVVIGVLSAMACAVLGNFLVLQRMSLMGDAISHAVLPGLAIAFLVTGSRSNAPMFLGAAAVGALTAVWTQWIHERGRVEQSAAMGAVFTTLFAAGLVLLVRAADHVDLDPGCVLYGAIEFTPLDTVTFWGARVPRAAAIMGSVFVLNAVFVAVFFKELQVASFDPGLATTLGINARAMHYALMTLVAVTTVAAFEAVGSIMVIAMMIGPAASAHLWTDRLRPMIVVSLAIAALGAALGHVLAIGLPAWMGHADVSASTAGMMATMTGVLFVASWLCAPRHGLARRWMHQAWSAWRVLREDVTGLLYRVEEARGTGQHAVFTVDMISACLQVGTWRVRLALGWLQRQGRVVTGRHGWELTDIGRTEAVKLVRSHRLWESYLHRYLQLPADHVHETAERLEHVTTPAMREKLAATTDQPLTDPHGKSVPDETSRP